MANLEVLPADHGVYNRRKSSVVQVHDNRRKSSVVEVLDRSGNVQTVPLDELNEADRALAAEFGYKPVFKVGFMQR